MLRKAAWQAGRHVQIIHVGGAGGDHPYYTHVQEGRYLKAVFARVTAAKNLSQGPRGPAEGDPTAARGGGIVDGYPDD